MAENTKIQWCDHTFNPWRGCTKIAAGCANCYADAQSKRNPGTLGTWGPNGTRVVASESMWRQPLKWNRDCLCWRDCRFCGHAYRAEWRDDIDVEVCPRCGADASYRRRRRVFCASLADVFEDWHGVISNSRGTHLATTEYTGVWFSGQTAGHDRALAMHDVRRRLFALIEATPNLDWLLLTKRPENIRRMLPAYFPGGYIAEAGSMNQEGPRPNVWLGTSIAAQADANRNLPLLVECRDLAAKLFVSAEPLIESVDLSRWLGLIRDRRGNWAIESAPKIDWLIIGGESGPHARPCDVAWIRSLVEQCRAAGVPCFVKQLGANVISRNDQIEDVFNNGFRGWPDPDVEHNIHGFLENYQGADCRIRLRDPKGGDPSEWPVDLRVREFPKAGGT